MIKKEILPVTREQEVVYCDTCRARIGLNFNPHTAVDEQEMLVDKCAQLLIPGGKSSNNGDMKYICLACYRGRVAPLFNLDRNYRKESDVVDVCEDIPMPVQEKKPRVKNF